MRAKYQEQRAALEEVLKLQFPDSDQRRVPELARKSNDGSLTRPEAAEYEVYVTAVDWLMLWHAKARLAL